MLTIEGVIEDIIFRNEDNGYTVAKLITDQGPLTIVGTTPFISLEETIKVKGNMVYHETYGEQFSFDSIEIVIPTTLKGIENYLGSGLIPGIGPATAKNIVKKFGADSLDIIQYNPGELTKVKGIGEKKIEGIIEAFEDQREIREIMIFLQEYDISVNYGVKIYKEYGPDTIGVIKENPYKLSEDIHGIGFKRADAIAKTMGVERDSPYRIRAGLRFVLMEAMAGGHCYLPMEKAIEKTKDILLVEGDKIQLEMKDMAMDGDLTLVKDGEDILVYSTHIYQAEVNVSKNLIDISKIALEDIDIDIEKKIKAMEEEGGIRFAEKQKDAIKESLENGLLVITGGPGTGKTTTINAIITIFEDLGLKVSLAAPTGRAAKRMTETSGREAQTIHRLLEYSFMEESPMAFAKDEDSPIEADVLIVDEASMIDILLMNSLLRALAPKTRVILVGDIDQLPSVGPGNVLRDIIDSEAIEVVRLDEIFRQSEESMIIVSAHRINKGEYPVMNKKDKDFYFIKKYNPKEIVKEILELCSKRLPSFYGIDGLKDIQVLSPMKKGDTGVKELNKSLQEILNPPSDKKEEIKFGHETYREGDKVMQMKNNYNLEWELIKNQVNIDSGEGVFNGDMGIITSISKEDKALTILYDEEKEVAYDFKQLDEISLSYATTVHKAQGSEFPVVVMPITWGPPMLLMRNLLYTAITRARQLVVLVGEEKYLSMMIRNNRIEKRYSSLDYNLASYNKMLEGV